MKLLVINLGYEGGCVYYANKICEELDLDKEIWVSKYSDEIYTGKCRKVNINRGLKSLIWRSIFILPILLLKITFKIITKEIQTIIVFGPHNWDCIFLFLFKLFHKKAFYVVHDGIMHTGESSKMHQFLLTKSMVNATNLVFLSENVKQNVETKLNIKKPYVIIPHGLINYSAQINEFTLLPEKPSLLMIGRINYYKGINLLIETLKLIDFDLINEIIIAGSFDKNSSLDLNFSNPKVKIIDKWLSSDEFDALVRKCDFLLMPYLEATQSGIAAVSIGYNKPAIVSNVGAMEEQFTSKGAYFFNELTPEAFYQTILIAISDKNKYENIQKELMELRNQLSWNSLANKLSKYIYENSNPLIK